MSKYAILRRVGSIQGPERLAEEFLNRLVTLTEDEDHLIDQPRYNPYGDQTHLVEFIQHGCTQCGFDSWAALNPEWPTSRIGEWCDLCFSNQFPGLGPEEVNKLKMNDLKEQLTRPEMSPEESEVIERIFSQKIVQPPTLKEQVNSIHPTIKGGEQQDGHG